MSGVNGWLVKELIGDEDDNREVSHVQDDAPLSANSKMGETSINRSQGSPRNNKNSQGEIKKPL